MTVSKFSDSPLANYFLFLGLFVFSLWGCFYIQDMRETALATGTITINKFGSHTFTQGDPAFAKHVAIALFGQWLMGFFAVLNLWGIWRTYKTRRAG